MKSRHFHTHALAALLLSSAGLAGQSTQSGDRLSGTWSGYIGRSEATPAAVTLEIKRSSDGKLSGTLTGPKLMPGDIKSGSFDPATGALKMTVVVRPTDDDKGGEVAFDGRVVNDTAAGSMMLRGETGVFKFAKGTHGVAAAKAAPEDAGLVAARRGFVEVSGWITRAAELIPAEKYSYRPVGTVRTFGEVVAHVVDGSKYYCARGTGKNVEWSDAAEKTAKTKAAITAALKQAFAECTTAYQGGKQMGPLIENVGHSSLHYGNLVTYIRMMGLVPPSSG